MQTGRKISLDMHFVHASLSHFFAQGYDLDELLKRSRIPNNLFHSGETRVTAQQFARLRSNAMLVMNDEMLGHTGKPLPLGAWKMMSHACISSKTLGEALERYCEFFNLIDWGIILELSLKDDSAFFIPKSSSKVALERFPYASCLMYSYRFISWLVEEWLPVTAFRFSCPKPAHHHEYPHMFVQSPIIFDQAEYSMEFPAEYLSNPIKQDALSLRRFSRHPFYEMLILTYDNKLWSSKIRKIIEAELTDIPRFNAIAESLGIPGHTLRRRLVKEGTSYRDIKNQTRLDAALYYLGMYKLSIEQVSERAGFSEASAFVRAFKNWTGVPPDQYRKHSGN
jgi:AraC-like DNA-binding protein